MDYENGRPRPAVFYYWPRGLLFRRLSEAFSRWQECGSRAWHGRALTATCEGKPGAPTVGHTSPGALSPSPGGGRAALDSAIRRNPPPLSRPAALAK
jgi:hypothetical protein